MPSILKQVCKPNFVSVIKTDGNHSSRLFVAKQLKRPTRKRRPDFSRLLSGQLIKSVFLFGLAPRGVYLAAPVTKRAGEALNSPFHPSPQISNLQFRNPKSKIRNRRGWSILCCTCRRLIFTSNARTLSGSLPFGVRTFLFHIFYKSDCPTCFNCKAQIS